MGKVIEDMVYPEGWHFLQDWKGQKIRIDSDSYRNLLVAVETWRVQNGVSIGNVLSDVETQLCQRHPNWCHGPARSPGASEVPSIAQSFADQIVAWGRRMLNSPINKTLVNSEEATRRASICTRCPRHIKWSTCASCSSSAEQLFTIARGMRDVPNGSSLKACSSYKFHCRSAVWMRKEALADTPGDQPWHECWLPLL